MDNQNINNAPNKRRKNHFTPQEKHAIVNTFKVCEAQHPTWRKDEKVDSVAYTLGIGVASVYNILREHKQHRDYFDPPKGYYRKRYILDKVSEKDKNGIIRIMDSFVLNNETPTLDKILMKVNGDEDLPNFRRSTLHKLLKEINLR